MSRLQKPTQEDNAKIINDITTENMKSTLQCTPANLSHRNDKNKPSSSKTIHKTAKPTHSDGNIIKFENSGFKQKLVNKVRSWNTKDAKSDILPSYSSKAEAALIQDIEALSLSNDNSEDNLCKPDWLRAKDSLENLLSPKAEKTTCSDINSRSVSLPNASQDKLIDSPSTSNSVSKVLTWDPWDKLGRKNKKENKRRKQEKSPLQSRDNSRQRIPDIESSRKGHMSGDEVRSPTLEETAADLNDNVNQEEMSYEYQPYHSPSTKSVDFTNEVMVVYFTGDEVINECTEPLKKELEQQIRNKEMRKGHLPAMLVGKKNINDSYMAAWVKK